MFVCCSAGQDRQSESMVAWTCGSRSMRLLFVHLGQLEIKTKARTRAGLQTISL